MTGYIKNSAINILIPHIYRIVETAYWKDMGDPAERVAKDRKFWQENARMLESEDVQKELDELKGEEKEFCQKLVDYTIKKMGNLSEEEMAQMNKEIGKELINENSRMAASILWQIVVHAGVRIFKKTGAQRIDVKEFLAKLDFEKYLASTIPEKYYPEIRAILTEIMPLILEKSFIGRAGKKYVEMFYLESLRKIILREVSWEIVQTWANSSNV